MELTLATVVAIILFLVSLGPLVESFKDLVWPEEWPPPGRRKEVKDS